MRQQNQLRLDSDPPPEIKGNAGGTLPTLSFQEIFDRALNFKADQAPDKQVAENLA